jgi:hypothetical protein
MLNIGPPGGEGVPFYVIVLCSITKQLTGNGKLESIEDGVNVM